MENREEVLRLLRISVTDRSEVDTARWGKAEDSVGIGLLGMGDRLGGSVWPGNPGGIYSRESRRVLLCRSRVSSSGRLSMDSVGLEAPNESRSTAYSSLKTLGFGAAIGGIPDVFASSIDNGRCEGGRRAMGAAPPC